ncbi:MAG: RNA polymerase sigma factor [Planctomycetaceae bacterium]|jgi:RNA polymerase sigma-70 factor (ECF subfamily)|nr:RNA polymerase sigma factor [Planctomycetaceae bacterium]
MSDDAVFDINGVVAGCLAGRETSIGALVRRYHGLVFSLCFRMLGQRQDAEDATQETFSRVLRSLAQWDSSRRFEPWLLTVAGNRCRTKMAKRQRQVNHVIEECGSVEAPRVESGLIFEEVWAGLQHLRDEYREVFVKFHLEHRSFEEIADELKMPYATVKTWCHRARKELADILARRGNLVEEIGQV